MVYLLLLALTGFFLLILYSIWVRIFGSQISYGMKRAALLIVLLAHIVPLIWLRPFYTKVASEILPENKFLSADIHVDMAEISASSKGYLTPYFLLSNFIVLVWIVFFARKLFAKYREYIKHTRRFQKMYSAYRWDEASEALERMRRKVPFRRRIRVIKVEEQRSPYTIGVLRPIVVLHSGLSGKELEWSLKHELTHIARGDMALKLLWEFVSCVYWFDPVLDDFSDVFSLVCEEACDEQVTRGFTEDERFQYARLITANLSRESSLILTSALSEGYEGVCERIRAITDVPVRKPWKKLAAAGVFTVFILMASMVALAYPDFYHVKDQVDSAQEVAAGNSFWAYGNIDFEGEQRALEILCDKEFIDGYGNIKTIHSDRQQEACSVHEWDAGFIQMHTKNGERGCAIKVYNGKYCARCGTIVTDSLHAEHYYNVCPHTNSGSGTVTKKE